MVDEKQYDKIADEYSQMMNPTKKYVIIPTFNKILGSVANKLVLDLACGDGFFTRLLAEKTPEQIFGVDISEELIKIAREKETKNNSGIEYICQDIMTLKLEKKFDVITAVYLLNYSKTKKDLFSMCASIYKHLEVNGKFYAITVNPDLKSMKAFEYERKITNLNNKDFFKDGDIVRYEIDEENKKSFEFFCHYWSKKTYEKCFKKAGFKSIEWIRPIISQEGINNFGKEYWKAFENNPSVIGLIGIK